MSINYLKKILPSRLKSANIEHRRDFQIQSNKYQKIINNGQSNLNITSKNILQNTSVISMINNLKKSRNEPANINNFNRMTMTITKKNSFYKGKLPKIQKFKLEEISDNSGIKANMTSTALKEIPEQKESKNTIISKNCVGSPALWMNKSFIKKKNYDITKKFNTIYSKEIIDAHRNRSNSFQYKILIHKNKVNSLSNFKPNNVTYNGNNIKIGNNKNETLSEIDENILSNAGEKITTNKQDFDTSSLNNVLLISKESNKSSNENNNNDKKENLIKVIKSKDLSDDKICKSIEKSGFSDKSGLWFHNLSKQLDMDDFLKKSYNGSNFKWFPMEIIHEGTGTIIYKSLNESLGSIIAVKRYIDPTQKLSYDSELNIYKNVSHKNIIKFYGTDIDNTSNNNFIYLEYIPTGTIKQLIDNYGPLKEPLIKIYTKQLLNVLIYLHKEKRIAHRDIKCSNILIKSNGKIKLCDFGCATFVKEKNSLVGLKGTLPWCAPEVLCNKNYDVGCDIWSLGCTIIEMGGMTPWNMKNDNYYQFINIVGKSNDIPPIPNYFSDILKEFIKLCLTRDVNKRPDVSLLMNHKFIIDD